VSLKELVDILKLKPGYLKSGPSRVSTTFDVKEEIALEAIREAKKLLKQARLGLADNSNDNDSVITEFESYLLENGINRDDVSSVKFWQTMGGEQRFSVVTKNDRISMAEIKIEIEEFAAIFSPTVYKQSAPFQDGDDGVAYEISLPDIHYGKLTELSMDAVEEQFMSTVYNLVDKAKGLNIEKFILPIGNDGMNSEGMRLTTTKGTFQHDAVGWRESFQGYCNLMTKAIDFLKTKAPVHVIVVSGNHDFERMFYAGDVIKGWYRNDKNVVVDNSMESRKYVEYGVNMLMFTHGDKEKPSEMPLIMATEQPEMFARCPIREVHCGHLHKEMVNEYRGIKVRFIPSICANDDWHRTMGYSALRTGQAYIWSKTNGLEGYLQTIVK
jgi:hypothetical protein